MFHWPLLPPLLLSLNVLGNPNHPRVSRSTDAPTVKLDKATFTGLANGTVSKFLGIQFAESTTGKNRFNHPVPVAPYSGNLSAVMFGDSCLQQNTSQFIIPQFIPSEIANEVRQALLPPNFTTSEDCLSVNVVAPASAKKGDKLPVVAWVYGGGYESGSSASFDGGVPVARSIVLGKPMIYVSMNYRLTAWGFLASKEVKESKVGNVGLEDQRLAFKWIQKYISEFGGDPSKVTIWGESAGAFSVGLHMLTNNGNTEGLFRAGFMQSGSPIPVGDITHGQPLYDGLVNATGCDGSSDTLACLRNASEADIQKYVDASPSVLGYSSQNLAWTPRADGRFLKDDPQKLVLDGSVADIPFVTGENDDEGTLFSFSSSNITTNAEFIQYLQSNYFPAATAAEIQAIAKIYPDNITAGSPFDTGNANAGTPEFKRLAAFQGDFIFTAPRRLLLNKVSSKQDAFVFQNKRLKTTPFIGSFHGSDIFQTFGQGELQDYLIQFVNDLNPNQGSKLPNWPRYTPASRNLLTLLDGADPITITQDDFRVNATDVLTAISLAHPL